MKDPRHRLPHALYRCHTCKSILTALDIVARWEAAEASGKPLPGACSCGSLKMTPANLTAEEEATFLSPERLAALLDGDSGPDTRVWRAALVEIRAGRAADATEEEKQAAFIWVGDFEPAPAPEPAKPVTINV